MNQKSPRLQHYVPQLLLRRFAGLDGKLWAYDTEGRKAFSAKPTGLAAEGYFYGGTTTHATKQSNEIEHWLSVAIEGPGAAALEIIQKKGQLSTEQAHAFFLFVAAQMQRTPASLQRASDGFAPSFQETAERMAKYHPEFRKNVIAEVKASGASDEELTQFIRILDEAKFTTTPTREFTIWISFDVMFLVAGELAKMKWTFLDVHPTDGDLIIGDHPVTLEDVGPKGTARAPLGVKNPNIEIVMPLSPRMAAIAHWDGPISYGQLAPGMADMLNERTMRNAHRFVFAAFESKELLEKAIALRGTGPKMRNYKVQLGEKLIMWNEFS